MPNCIEWYELSFGNNTLLNIFFKLLKFLGKKSFPKMKVLQKLISYMYNEKIKNIQKCQ